jgi:hypothetical protein
MKGKKLPTSPSRFSKDSDSRFGRDSSGKQLTVIVGNEKQTTALSFFVLKVANANSVNARDIREKSFGYQCCSFSGIVIQ